MYYTTNGAYRKFKMSIDIINIVLTLAIAVLFVGIIFFKQLRDILFPAIFVAGGLTNATSGVKELMNYNRLSGLILFAVAIGLFLLGLICWKVL